MSFRRLLGPALFAAVVVVVALAVIGGRDSGYSVRAEFADASGLRTNSLVELAGQPIGRVRTLALTKDDHVVATLDIDSSAGRIGDGATAKVRPANLLGEKYVDLAAGNRTKPMPSGGLIPLARTGTPVELDDVLDVLDTPTRAALAALINESGIALTGRRPQFAQMLQAMPSSFDHVQQLLSELGSDNQALGHLVESSDRVVGEIAAHRNGLGNLVTAANRALSATASRNQNLEATVRDAPPALSQLEGSLARLRTTAVSLGGASDAITTSAPALTQLLQQVKPFADAARPTLRTAADVAPQLTRLGTRAAPSVSRLLPVADDLDRFARVFAGVTDALNDGTADALGAAEGWARAIQGRDGAGHLFRNDASLTADTVKSLINTIARQEAPGQRRSHTPSSPHDSAAPAATPTAPALPQVQIPGVKLPDLTPLLDRVQGVGKQLPVKPPATGNQQVDDLLDFLLGS